MKLDQQELPYNVLAVERRGFAVSKLNAGNLWKRMIHVVCNFRFRDSGTFLISLGFGFVDFRLLLKARVFINPLR